MQGTGGAGLYGINTTLPESQFSYNASHGATMVRADDHFVVFESITTSRDLIDVFSVPSKADSSASKRALFAKATVWSYKDDGAAPPANWTKASFDASAWSSGPALLGYGQPGVQTTVSFGSNAAQKHVTTYFCRTFDVKRLDDVAWLSLALRKDDGAVVYINGTEVHRSNMPKGTIGPQTEAAYRTGYVAEDAWEPVALDASVLKVGTNAISVELHQSGAATSDALFDAILRSTPSCADASRQGFLIHRSTFRSSTWPAPDWFHPEVTSITPSVRPSSAGASPSTLMSTAAVRMRIQPLSSSKISQTRN